MEHFGVWKGREVYTVTHTEYVRYEYYKPDTTVAFWILDDDYFVADNKIVGKVVRELGGRIIVDDTVKIAGSRYDYTAWYEPKKQTKEKLCEEIGVSKEVLFTNTAEALSSADEILAGVYTSKLWED
jgi:hypothetical protein